MRTASPQTGRCMRKIPPVLLTMCLPGLLGWPQGPNLGAPLTHTLLPHTSSFIITQSSLHPALQLKAPDLAPIIPKSLFFTSIMKGECLAAPHLSGDWHAPSLAHHCTSVPGAFGDFLLALPHNWGLPSMLEKQSALD